MIVKKVKADRPKGKASHIRDLTNYILDPSRRNAEERVLYSGGTGFIWEDFKSQQNEMMALAHEAVRSKNPISHYILSWREGEQPTPKQVEQAVSIFMDELGLKGHQVIYALHSDTDNIHLHLAVNRVHPETEKVIKPNRGFDIEAGHRAIARIEHLQGWQPEENARYQVLENGELVRAQQQKKRQPSQKARDMEVRTGEKSAERIGIEEGAGIIREARSWAELHQRLAQRGMKLEKKGSGALLWVGQTPVKASSAGRDCSLSALQKCLGQYEPPEAVQERSERSPEPLKQGQVPDWSEYIAGRKVHYAEKDREWREQHKRHEAERKELSERQREERSRVLAGDWYGRGELLNAMRSVLAAQQAAAKAELKDKHQRDRKTLRGRYPRFLDFEEWLRKERGGTQAERWRYRESDQVPRLEGERFIEPKPRDIRSFVAEMHGGQVRYRRGQQGHEAAGAVSFVDRGKQIDIHEAHERDSVLAALQLSAQKWGVFHVRGTEEFKRLCVELAAEHGFRLANPELEQAIAVERKKQQDAATALQQQRREARPQSTKPVQAAAGPADIYRRHYQDIRSRQGQALDLSRVDAMIAVRMRVTGHSQAVIASTLAECAPTIREQLEVRNWQSYAKRTTRYAFGVAGDRQLEQLVKYREEWRKLEGQERQQEQRERSRSKSRGPEMQR